MLEPRKSEYNIKKKDSKNVLSPALLRPRVFNFLIKNKLLLHLDTKKSECSLKLILSLTMTPKNLVSVAGMFLYHNSSIFQALELPPQASEASRLGQRRDCTVIKPSDVELLPKKSD